MSHTWTRYITHMNESCHTHEGVMSHTHEGVMSHTHDGVMSHTHQMSDALTWLALNNVSHFEHALVDETGGACYSFDSYLPGLWAPTGILKRALQIPKRALYIPKKLYKLCQKRFVWHYVNFNGGRVMVLTRIFLVFGLSLVFLKVPYKSWKEPYIFRKKRYKLCQKCHVWQYVTVDGGRVTVLTRIFLVFGLPLVSLKEPYKSRKEPFIFWGNRYIFREELHKLCQKCYVCHCRWGACYNIDSIFLVIGLPLVAGKEPYLFRKKPYTFRKESTRF